MALKPEERARVSIDQALEQAGWVVQDVREGLPPAGRAVAVREVTLRRGHGRADYLLFLSGLAVGALEAKKDGEPLTGVEGQAKKYSEGLPDGLEAPVRPLPFLYVATSKETRFTNRLDPQARSRRIFSIHRPENLAEWLRAEPLSLWVRSLRPAEELQVADPSEHLRWDDVPSTLRSRLRTLPKGEIPHLWDNQRRAIEGLEASLAKNHPRALIQMATGSGKSLMAVVSIYRLIKFGGARRVLFLVDRANLGKQAEGEFAKYRTYDDHRKFTELYNVQRLTSQTIGSSSKVVITTIQRLYSILKGEAEMDPALEEESAFEDDPRLQKPVPEVAYNAAVPPEHFDVIFIDECHRSIYTLWRQVLEYFDGFLVGLTATPAKHTFGFFRQNLVMEYSHEEAVADGVNVDFDVYRIRSRITEQGSTIEAAPGTVVKFVERPSGKERWEAPDEDITYTANQLDRDVVAVDQIRLLMRTFKERLFTEIFPGRETVPKTLIFAKDDAHAENIVRIVREVFGERNEFCQKITYKVSGPTPEELIQQFRMEFHPRIAVTVDMIATGTDVKPLEIVMFLRKVKSRVLYEQMKGRGSRVALPDEMEAVTPGVRAKTHFMLVDCVGVTESPMNDTRPLEKKRSLSFEALIEHLVGGGTDPDVASSLASRLSRLAHRLGETSRRRLQEAAPGFRLRGLAHDLVEALDPDLQEQHAREIHSLDEEAEPSEAQLESAWEDLLGEAVRPLVENRQLRELLIELKRMSEQMHDEVSQDELLEAGLSPEARERARELVQSFESYLEEHKDEIEALQIFYSQPYERRLRFEDIQALADAIEAPPRNWTPDRLWQAYRKLDESRVRGAGGQRLLTDVVSLVRYALHQEGELVPYAEQVQARFATWLAQQETAGRTFTEEQMQWLTQMRDHVAQSLEIRVDDFEYTPFVEQGGLGRARQVFGEDLNGLLDELNEALAA